jgi:hypothetical protein
MKGQYVHAVMVAGWDGTSECREVNEQQPDRFRAILIVKPDGSWDYSQRLPVQSRRSGTWSLARWPFVGPTFWRFPSRLPIAEEQTWAPELWVPRFVRQRSGQLVSLCGMPHIPCFERAK